MRIFIFLLLTSFIIPFSVVGLEDFPEPVISISPDVYYPLDEVLFIEGRSLATTTVQVHFEMPGAKPLNFNVKSDVTGAWVLAERVPLESGNWEVRARILLSSGAFSDWSNPRIIKVVITGFSVGGLNIKYAPIAALIVLMLVIAFVFLMYSVFKVRIAQRLDAERALLNRDAVYEKTLRDRDREIEKEREAHAKADELEKELQEKERKIAKLEVEQTFLAMKQSIHEELDHLSKKIQGGDVLSREELQHHEALLAKLRDVEDKIGEKL